MTLAERLTRWLADHPAVERGVLFGSTNDGAAGFASDLNLAVMGPRPLSAEETKAAIETLSEDWDVQDILTLNLTRAVQLCADLAAHVVASSEQPVPDTMAASFDSLHALHVIDAALAGRMRGAVGFRNVAVHNYRKIDWDIVYAICHEHVGDFRTFARAIHRNVLDEA